MNWSCAICGSPAKTNRRKCPKCGSLKWRPAAEMDLAELAGPIKRITPKGLLLANPKETPIQDSRIIECGRCQAVIYRADDGFDAKAFQEAKKKHYSTSPACEKKK